MNRSILTIAAASFAGLLLGAFTVHSQSPAASSPPVPAGATPNAQSTTNGRTGLNIVVIDPAHGGTDPGARGGGGIREADIVLELTAQLRHALENQGFQVLQTRTTN